MFRSRDIKSSFHRSSDPQNFANATQTALQGSQSLRLPQSLRLYRQRFTQSALRGSRSAAHAMKSAVPVRRRKKTAPATSPATEGAQSAAYKVPLLPRNLLLEVLKMLCLQQMCTSNAQSAAPATKPATGGAQSAAAPATKFAVPLHKVLRAPRDLHIQIHIAQRCQGSLQWQAQLFVRDSLFLIQINLLFDGI